MPAGRGISENTCACTCSHDFGETGSGARPVFATAAAPFVRLFKAAPDAGGFCVCRDADASAVMSVTGTTIRSAGRCCANNSAQFLGDCGVAGDSEAGTSGFAQFAGGSTALVLTDGLG